MKNLTDIDHLKLFIDDNEDLERLETILDKFNLFESLNLVRQEIRHSAFLRWLLDPTETHGLGGHWLRQFLKRVIKSGEDVLDGKPSLFDLDDWDMGHTEVRREWRNIDILILDEKNLFVCVIENKVDSGEAQGQLKRYRELVEREFEEYKKAYVFLTIAGDAPSDETEPYIPMSYKTLRYVIGNALIKRESQLSDEIKLFIQQYLEMIGRHIVGESEIQQLCQRLYKNHHRALELIFEYRPDRASEVSQSIQGYIKEQDDLLPIYMSKAYMNFLPQSMNIQQIQNSKNFPILYCQLLNKSNQVRLKLELGQGPAELRNRIYEKAKSLPELFGKSNRNLSDKYHSFFSETWITSKEYEELGEEELKQKVGERIARFMEVKGNAITNALMELA